ncbi:MAG: lipoyl synthase [Verrucomicrobiota bacterium]|jgi:lipoic acid synthetase|nr:lipoyl synthase [Verrucomicrobiota bacterium]MDD8051231.1 lipoyl synthase [Verrucomicrobiota bacterium]
MKSDHGRQGPGPIPQWLINQSPKRYFRDHIQDVPLDGSTTVCQEARCPNRGECLAHGIVTFMIMGNVCTRNCPFCAVEFGRPPVAPDPQEPEKLIRSIRHLGLRYVVITSPNRDELPDGGAGHYALCIQRIREEFPSIGIEILIPDFLGKPDCFDRLIAEPPNVLAHDLQTVPRLYRQVRPGHKYERSLDLFRYFHEHAPDLPLKAGIMVGFGETLDEVAQLLNDFRQTGGTLFTIGQYLKPGPGHLDVVEYVPLERYREFTAIGRELGIQVQASPLTRSSYMAERLADRLATNASARD